ncbi:hypothetical protein D3C87_1855930 [compost metagenome]
MRNHALDEFAERARQVSRRDHEAVAAFAQEQFGQLLGDLRAGAHQLRHAHAAGENPSQLLEGGFRALHQQLFGGGRMDQWRPGDLGQGCG